MRKYAGEFIETSLDRLDDVEAELLRLEPGAAIGADRLAGLKREIHSIKGHGTTFGFPLVSRIAHLLEDYLALPRRPDAKDLCAFIGAMADVLREDRNPPPEESARILRALPLHRARTRPRPAVRSVHVHLAMPPGLHARIVKRELASCGFRVSQSDDAARSLVVVMSSMPDIVIANLELKAFSGVELAQMMSEFDATRHIRFILLTDCAKDDPRLSGLPREAATIGTNANYAYSLGELLVKWGVFLPAGKFAPALKDTGKNIRS